MTWSFSVLPLDKIAEKIDKPSLPKMVKAEVGKNVEARAGLTTMIYNVRFPGRAIGISRGEAVAVHQPYTVPTADFYWTLRGEGAGPFEMASYWLPRTHKLIADADSRARAYAWGASPPSQGAVWRFDKEPDGTYKVINRDRKCRLYISTEPADNEAFGCAPGGDVDGDGWALMTVPLGYGGSYGAPPPAKPAVPADHEELEPKDGDSIIIANRADPAKRLGLKDGAALMVGGAIADDQYWTVEKQGDSFTIRNSKKENLKIKGDSKLQVWGEGRAGTQDAGAVTDEQLWTFKADRLGWRVVNKKTGGNLFYDTRGAENLFVVEHATMGGRDYADAEVWDIYKSSMSAAEK